jgi:hypothetical protein
MVTSATCAYRSLEPVLQQRLDALREQRSHDAARVDVARRVARRRMGRAWAGAFALACGLVAFAVGLASLPADSSSERALHDGAAALLLLAPLVGAGALLCGRAVAGARLARILDTPPRLTGDVAADLARIAAADPLRASREVAMRWERMSVALPIAAASILAPLTLHGLVFCTVTAASGGLGASAIDAFGTWIGLSALIVGHAHVAVLVGTVRWAYRLRATPTEQLRRDLHKHWGSTLLVAVGLSCIPGVVLLGIPPLLVAITGVAFLPAAYGMAARAVARERVALDAV